MNFVVTPILLVKLRNDAFKWDNLYDKDCNNTESNNTQRVIIQRVYSLLS